MVGAVRVVAAEVLVGFPVGVAQGELQQRLPRVEEEAAWCVQRARGERGEHALDDACPRLVIRQERVWQVPSRATPRSAGLLP
eukprot:scaffold62599_cov66-Phaeocystis_antarctica.AAC.8